MAASQQQSQQQPLQRYGSSSSFSEWNTITSSTARRGKYIAQPLNNPNSKNNNNSVSSFTRTRVSTPSPPPPLVLDLHGFVRLDAVQRLVEFLDAHQRRGLRHSITSASSINNNPDNNNYNNNSTIVQVITGTGCHSNATNGPVLKPAVESFLLRHAFCYRYAHGCFAIHVASGVLQVNSNSPNKFNSSNNVDTKVVVLPAATTTNYNNNTISVGGGVGRKLMLGATNNNNNQYNNNNNSIIANNTNPTLQQVVREEALLREGLEASRLESQTTDARRRQAEHQQERDEIQAALAHSLLAYRQQTCVDDDEYDELLERAIQQSAELEESERNEEEEWIRQALESIQQREDNAAAAAERNNNNNGMGQKECWYDNEDCDDDEEEMLHRALLQSIEWEASERDEEERLIQQVMAISVATLYTGMDERETMDTYDSREKVPTMQQMKMTMYKEDTEILNGNVEIQRGVCDTERCNVSSIDYGAPMDKNNTMRTVSNDMELSDEVCDSVTPSSKSGMQHFGIRTVSNISTDDGSNNADARLLLRLLSQSSKDD